MVPLSGKDFLERNFFGHVVMSKDAGGTVNGLTTRYGEQELPPAGWRPSKGTYDSISDAGAITGHYVDSNNVNHGFLRIP